MVKIRIACVGKLKEKYYSQAVEEYCKRITRFAEISVVEVKEEFTATPPDNAKIRHILSEEGKRLEKECRGVVICLAIEGKRLSSEGFAEMISSYINRGEGELTFVIGGSHGISDSLKRQASALVSFSEMTFPHALARVMLTEQIYRAFSISAGGKYHK